MLTAGDLTEQVIELAIEVHRHTGPGLLESLYEQCLCHELREADIPFERQVAVPVVYKDTRIGQGFRADIAVAREVILEIKSVAAILPVHELQLLTYLRMSGLRVGLIMNFNARRMTEGIRRYVACSRRPWNHSDYRGPPFCLRGKIARALQAQNLQMSAALCPMVVCPT